MLHSFGGMLINGQYLDGSILQNNYHLNATNLWSTSLLRMLYELLVYPLYTSVKLTPPIVCIVGLKSGSPGKASNNQKLQS